MKVAIQSFIDLITNSSMEVYQMAVGTGNLEAIIDAVLKASGSELKCKDLFKITIEEDEDYNPDWEGFRQSSYQVEAIDPNNKVHADTIEGINWSLFHHEASYDS